MVSHHSSFLFSGEYSAFVPWRGGRGKPPRPMNRLTATEDDCRDHERKCSPCHPSSSMDAIGVKPPRAEEWNGSFNDQQEQCDCQCHSSVLLCESAFQQGRFRATPQRAE